MNIHPSVQRAFNEWNGYVLAYEQFRDENENDEDFIDNYWSDETAAFGWHRSKEDPNNLLLVYELAVGGPNAHLVFTYKITEEMPNCYPSIEVDHIKTEFQFHWWSPVSALDLTETPKDTDAKARRLFETAETVLEQIEEEAKDWLERNYDEMPTD